MTHPDRASGKSTILVVEDEVDSRETLRELLELEGYEVRTAGNGREALAELEAAGEEICVVLLDLFMPVMDGWQVIEELRSSGKLATTKVVLITSASHLAPAGIPAFQKPLDLEKVIRHVHRLC